MATTDAPLKEIRNASDINGEGNFPQGCAFSPDGLCILTCTSSQFRLYNTHDPSPWKAALACPAVEAIRSYAWYPNMKSNEPISCCFVATSRDQPIHLYDAYTGKVRAHYRPYNALDEMESPNVTIFSPDGQTIVAGGFRTDRVLHLFSAARPGRDSTVLRLGKTRRSTDGQKGLVSALCYNNNNDEKNPNVLAVGTYSPGSIYLYDVRMELPAGVVLDGRCVVGHGQNHSRKKWRQVGEENTEDGDWLTTAKIKWFLKRAQTGITQLQFASHILYSASRRSDAVLSWDLRMLSGHCDDNHPPNPIMNGIGSFSTCSHTNQRLEFDIRGSTIYIGGQDNCLRMYDVTTGKLRGSLTNLDDVCNGVSTTSHASFDRIALATGSRRFLSDDEEIKMDKFSGSPGSLRLYELSWIFGFLSAVQSRHIEPSNIMAPRQTKRRKVSAEKRHFDHSPNPNPSLPPCCIRLPRAGSHDLLQDPPALLAAMLGSMDPRTFLETHFRQSAVYCPGSVKRFRSIIQDYFFGLDPQRLLRNTSSDSIFVWLPTPEDNRIHSIEIADAEQAYALYRSGHSIYCRAPPSFERFAISTLLRNTGLGCGGGCGGDTDVAGTDSVTRLGRGEVEMFLTSPNSLQKPYPITDWHFDFQENFTFQLSGIKRWSLQHSTVSYPLRGCTPHYNSPDTVEAQLKAARLADPNFRFGQPNSSNAVGSVETVELHPGDILYHPAGIWHRVEVLEAGVSINISLMATSYASMTCHALQHVLLQRREWRETVCDNSTRSAKQTLQSLLRELPVIVRNWIHTTDSGDDECEVASSMILPACLRNVGPRPHFETSDRDSKLDEADARESEMNNKEEDVDDNSNNDDEDEVPFSPDHEEDDEDLENHDVCINADEFKLDEGGVGSSSGRIMLSLNPLALVLDEVDITSYYQKNHHNENAKESKEEGDGSRSFVLNCNYAGTESLESAIRIRFRTRYWHEIAKRLKGGEADCIPNEIHPLVHFLKFYGAISWTKAM